MSTETSNPDLDADALFAALEAETDLDDPSLNPSYRAARLQQLSKELEQSKQNNAASAGGSNQPSSSSSNTYVTLTSDPEVLTFTTSHPRTILHFYHPDFSRCSIMDTHLEEIARLHPVNEDGGEGRERTTFGRVDVRKAEFVVQKLGVRVLPCVVGFIDGQVQTRVTGFEGVSFGGKENGIEVTRGIEAVFVRAGVLSGRKVGRTEDEESEDEDAAEGEERRNRRRGIKGRTQQVADSDDDWD